MLRNPGRGCRLFVCVSTPPPSTGQYRRHLQAQKRTRRRSQAADRGDSSAAEPTGDVRLDERAQLEDLEEALKAVEKAIKQAESGLDSVDSLPSSKLPSEASTLLKLARLAAALVAVVAAVVASHSFGWPFRIAAGISAGLGLGIYGYWKGSLSQSGALAAAAVGAATLSSSIRAALVLLAFYFSSSKLTTYCEDRKLDDESFKQGGQRDWKQVFCNGFVPSLLAVAAVGVSGGADLPLLSPGVDRRLYTPLSAAFLGYFACCCGDTWASELGQLSDDQPRLVTSLRPVRKGTNGGVTRLGLLASAGGGLCIGFAFYLAGLLSPSTAFNPTARSLAVRQYLVVPFGLFVGLAGSLVDSVLGATLQFTGYNRSSGKITSKLGDDVTRISGLPFLDNNAVNLVSASLAAVSSAAISVFAVNLGVVGV